MWKNVRVPTATKPTGVVSVILRPPRCVQFARRIFLRRPKNPSACLVTTICCHPEPAPPLVADAQLLRVPHLSPFERWALDFSPAYHFEFFTRAAKRSSD
jgi:hypothetical protein